MGSAGSEFDAAVSAHLHAATLLRGARADAREDHVQVRLLHERLIDQALRLSTAASRLGLPAPRLSVESSAPATPDVDAALGRAETALHEADTALQRALQAGTTPDSRPPAGDPWDARPRPGDALGRGPQPGTGWEQPPRPGTGWGPGPQPGTVSGGGPQTDTTPATQPVPIELPPSSPVWRALLVYGVGSVLAWIVQFVLLAATDYQLGPALLSLCGLPLLAYGAGMLTLHLLGPSRGGERIVYSARLGAVICFAALPAMWLILLLGFAILRD